ncbi:MAG: enoyl-CoA hydratase-related protein [Candidatus Thalassarchaeaceae archaeon]|nr:enoyl-CoA hydratase-related protein [Candidatus Thalassarchaeaceae archaeon]
MTPGPIPETELCRLELDGAVANLTLDRTDVFNALNAQIISEMAEVLEWTAERSVGNTGELLSADGSPNLRALVIRSEGKHFCAGADINMMRDGGGKTPEENREDSERLDRLFHGLWSHPCFTIACVQGVALGGGAGLVACSDHVIAEPNTRIALSEAKLGISAAVIGPYVYRRLGSAGFRRLAMLASRIGSEEALRIGFVDEVAGSAEDMEGSVSRVTSEVMTSGPLAVTSAKRMVSELDRWEGDDESLRSWTLDLTSKMRGSPEGQEGLSAFLDGRKPAWSQEDREV